MDERNLTQTTGDLIAEATGERAAPRLLTAASIIVVYVIAAGTTSLWLLGVRPVFDDGPYVPASYRWSCPPQFRKTGNIAPTNITGTLKLDPSGSAGGTVATDDAQATITFLHGAFRYRTSQRSIRISINAKCPSSIGAPPSQMSYDGNAYQISAVYEPSGLPADTGSLRCDASDKICPTLVLRFVSSSAKAIYRRTGDTWTLVPKTTLITTSMQAFSEVPALGIFVMTDSGSSKPSNRSPVGAIISIAAAVIAVVIGFIASRRRTRRRARLQNAK